ncbi:MAG: redoxin family protein [Candidatus Kapabacteria bacterium]|nr:redoxin family protein [Candidatus Kapabacteria bacterium]
MRITNFKISKLFLSFILFYLSITVAIAGKLEINPAKPQQAAKIKLHYFADDRVGSRSSVYFNIYCFSAGTTLPVAHEIKALTNNSEKEYLADFTLPDDCVYGLIKIYIKNEKKSDDDNNAGTFWDFRVYTAEKPILGASLRAGLANLGNLQDNIKKSADLNKSFDLLSEESVQYPQNLEAQIGLVSLELDMQKITKDIFDSKITDLVKSEYSKESENDVRAICRALRTLNKTDKADRIERKFIQNNPKSSLSEEKILTRLSEAESLIDFTDVAHEFIVSFPNSSHREKIFSAIVSAFIQISKYKELLEFLDQHENVPAIAYNQIALDIVDNEASMPGSTRQQRIIEALKICSQYLTNVINEPISEKELKHKPHQYTALEWLDDQYLLHGTFAETIGSIYYSADSLKEAEKYFAKALELEGLEVSSFLLEKYISTEMDLGNYQKALLLANSALIASKSSVLIEKNHYDIYIKLFPAIANDTAKYDKYLDSLADLAFKERVSKLRYLKQNLNAIPYNLISTDGKHLSSEELKGKIVIMEFWATWCGPCQAKFPAFEAISKKLEGSKDIVYVIVDIWERAGSKLNDIIEFKNNNKLTFPIYLDELGLIQQKLSLTGLPVTVYFDKEGRIQFKEYGYSSDTALQRDIEDRLKAIE